MDPKRAAAEKAVEYVSEGMVIGLGTGSTAYFMIKKIGELVSQGLNIMAVATSKSTEKLALALNIPLLSIDEVDKIDLMLDGVDEIDASFNAVKGGGGALFREKIVANLANRVIWIMDESKLVDRIGNFPLPIEILPFGYTHLLKKLDEYALNPVLRIYEGKTYITDNGNYMIDLHLENAIDLDELHRKLSALTGVLETGLFINICEKIIIGSEDGVRIVENNSMITK